MPDNASIFLLGEKHIWVDAEDGAFIHAANTGGFAVGSGSGFGVVATDSKVNIGGLSSADKDSLSAKDSSTICIEDSKIKATGGGAEMELADKVTIDGDKIMLG